MARILIGWELGANRGHVVRTAPAAAKLRALGHDVALGLQQVDSLGLSRDVTIPIFQSPVWPRLLASAAVPVWGHASTMIDILCRLGLEKPGTLSAIMSGWDAILSAWKPDIVVGDFAPALLCAAHGRAITVSSGTGFVQPPAYLDEMPRLAGAPGFDEAMALDIIDADLRSIGRDPLRTLPALFSADHYFVETFQEIDPYRAFRQTPWCAPGIAPASFDGSGSGDEIFVYAFSATMGQSVLWDALRKSGKRVRIYIPDADSTFVGKLRRAGFIVETSAVTWREIARRSRLVVSHGGHGFLCSALLAGLPHLVTYYDLEKQLHAGALSASGLGTGVQLHYIDADACAAAINTAYDNEALALRVRKAAPDFAARMQPDFGDRLLTLASAIS
ncbi:glycosyl transferase-like UDP-glucuronosyltransferase [Sphingomonas paeninsulae]|uniref:Glycosyl transferase-like UDP-glucuronosyltransferase n=1 Tax=Sphingomonas paeninsulae TaxID=2319844 RepID=A0A494TJN4_SPHPE|nr:glycosyl transferase-like UDP-glucuronosyltransferase [Sphingomonas paeninsulae]AYJ86026.1 glycosyl transferase-like UDP-glucuronosyltransferase [Sphingomonas paeninsulae]